MLIQTVQQFLVKIYFKTQILDGNIEIEIMSHSKNLGGDLDDTKYSLKLLSSNINIDNSKINQLIGFLLSVPEFKTAILGRNIKILELNDSKIDQFLKGEYNGF